MQDQYYNFTSRAFYLELNIQRTECVIHRFVMAQFNQLHPPDKLIIFIIYYNWLFVFEIDKKYKFQNNNNNNNNNNTHYTSQYNYLYFGRIDLVIYITY